jgi:hypothetical protein
MEASFNPYHMRPLATLNSRAVSALPGIEPRLVGLTGSTLLSRRALIGLVEPQAGALGLEGADPADFPRLLNERLAEAALAGDRMRSAAGESIAGEFGKRLGSLIASMALAPMRLTDPLDAWEAAYLRQWREGVSKIILGGGHATGRLGARIARAAGEALAACGLEWPVRAADHAAYLPLIGAARSLPGGDVAARLAVVADFGGTRGKSGVACYDSQGRLSRLLALPPRSMAALVAAGDVAGTAAMMVAVMAGAVKAALDENVPLDPRILCSLGAYVENGEPLNTDRGIYNRLNRLSADLKGWFSAQVSQASGQEMAVSFEHDCDLAACSQAGQARSATIMLGSAIGVGFAPPGEGYRQVAEEFEVIQYQGG